MENAADFIRAGAEAVGVGGELVDLEAIRHGNPEKIILTARSYLDIIAAGTPTG